jgi:toxin-antitoxin system PIN domain toxin
MIIPDTNLLLYAHVPSFREHSAAKSWLEDSLNSGKETVGLSWQVIISYIRIGTNPKLFQTPITVTEADTQMTRLIKHPLVEIILPQSGHWEIFINLIKKEQVTADLVMDAHLAALAIEHKAGLATTDRDFTRFGGLKFFNPLAGRI